MGFCDMSNFPMLKFVSYEKSKVMRYYTIIVGLLKEKKKNKVLLVNVWI